MSHRRLNRSAARAPGSRLPIVGQLTLAVRLIALGGVLPMAAQVSDALAQGEAASAPSTSDQEARSYDIPAGPLTGVLTRFSHEAGVYLVGAGNAVEGKISPGLKGRYSVPAGFAALLAGTGLEAFRQADGEYALRQAAQMVPHTNAIVTLPVVEVTALAERGGATEGTGRYTSTASLGTATPLGLTLKETPQSVSVITSQRMEDQSLTTVEQALGQVPGIAVPTMGTERVWIQSRSYGIMNYQLDGVNTYSENRGLGASPAQSLTDMALYDRIEVLRGASGLMTGAGDPAGTVNLVRRKPTADFQGSVEAGIGSWNDKRAVLDLSGPLNEARNVRGRLIAVGQDRDSYIDDYGTNKGLFYGVLEADPTSTTRITAGVEHLRRRSTGAQSYLGWPLWFGNGERTDLPRSFNSASRDSRFTTRSTSLFATLEQELSNHWRLKVSANRLRSSQSNDSLILAVYGGFPDASTGDGLNLVAERYAFEQDVDSVDVNVRGPFSLFGRQHELVLGADYQRYNSHTDSSDDLSGLDGSPANLHTWDHTGTGVYGDTPSSMVDVPRRQKSLYAAARFELSDRLKFIVGTKVFLDSAKFSYAAIG